MNAKSLRWLHSQRFAAGPRFGDAFAAGKEDCPKVARSRDQEHTGGALGALTGNLVGVRDLFDNDGTVADHLTREGYGSITCAMRTSADYPDTYSGHEHGEQPDHQFNWARYYHPNLGQWISEDPIGFAAGDKNVRRYVANAPTNATDPTGMQEDAIDEISKALGGKVAPDNKPKVANIGPIDVTVTSEKSGKPVDIKITIVEISGNNVTFLFEFGGKTNTYTKPLTVFSKEDQAFIKQLQVVPPNYVVKPSKADPSFLLSVFIESDFRRILAAASS